MLVIVVKGLILSLVQLIPLTVKGLGAGVGRAEKEFGLNVSVGLDIKNKNWKKKIKQIYFLEKYLTDRYIWLAISLICPVKADHFEAIFSFVWPSGIQRIDFNFLARNKNVPDVWNNCGFYYSDIKINCYEGLSYTENNYSRTVQKTRRSVLSGIIHDCEFFERPQNLRHRSTHSCTNI